MAERLGFSLMPWQRYVLDVILELDPDTGLLVYDEFGLTVPRQSGKSTLILTKAVHRAFATQFFGPRQRLVYTAQTRNKAREKWEEDFAAELLASPTFASRVTPHYGNGNEHLRFPNGSRFGIEANTEKAGHGGTLDEAYIDEAFAQADNRLEQAFRPAMITRRNTQIGWVSTAGWLGASPFLEGKVRRGRELVELGVREGLAYFEWSAADDEDREDPKTWAGCMPALGHTITEAAIAAELRAMADNPTDFDRAYLNRWVHKDAAEATVIDLARWAALEDAEPPKALDVAIAVDVAPDRSTASVAFAGRRPDGKRHVELVDNRAGTAWIVAAVSNLRSKRPGAPVALDTSGPAGSLLDALRGAGIDAESGLLLTGARDMAAACGAFYDAVAEGTLTHYGQAELATAIGAARKRPLGDAWAWHRRGGADITPLVSATLALFALERTPKRRRTGKVW